MTVKEPVTESRWSLMEMLFGIGCGLILASTIFGNVRTKLSILFAPSLSREYLIELLETLLLVVVAILVFRWIFAAYGELRLLRDYFREYIDRQPGQVYVWTVIFSVLLGTLASMTGSITAFSAVFSVYSLGDLWGQYLRDTQIRKALVDIARNREEKNGVSTRRQLVAEYYLNRPQMQRVTTIMFFSFTALAIAQAGNSMDSDAGREWLHASAYAVVIMNIVVSELVIWRWRKFRDRNLRESYSF